MKEYLTKWRERYAKVLRDYPELKEASNIWLIEAHAVETNKNCRVEQKLQQTITAALICDNPCIYDERNVMEYSLEVCNTPTDCNYYSHSPVSFELMYSLKNRCSTPLYKRAVERLEQIYFTL